ncbi:hypothetical protein OKA04_09605 [Luteolibacter flavescens]|uniref:Uncharacterized protein n=1 Tax=Luteolibacter flavescens TaxID=1859460 RepID=A0ABT3FN27_9BACT|nr:hypothetical protein [Luteolibacter flavescens]MCW1884981.1 hypothetical protein [Luteolibacter flavescens]
MKETLQFRLIAMLLAAPPIDVEGDGTGDDNHLSPGDATQRPDLDQPPVARAA